MTVTRGLAAILLAACMLEPAGAQVAKFRYQPERIDVGTLYRYVKTNLDGSHVEHVSMYVADRDRIEVFKGNAGYSRFALVVATMDWRAFSVGALESWQVFADGTRKLAATLKYQPDPAAVRVSVPLMGRSDEETLAVPTVPFHVYNFDFASLNFAMRHLIDPDGRFVVGVTDPAFKPDGPLFLYRGEVEVAYAGDEERVMAACRKYRIDGAGLDNRGGFIWVDKARGHVVDMEIELPDNPDWQSFKFRLEGVERLDRDGWERFMTSHYGTSRP